MNNATKEIDDIDDDIFVSKRPQNYIFAEKKAQDITERTQRILANTRSIVQESEQVGQSTLENLASQRETLERVENDLDSINTMTRATQKHLNNMKSFFGGIKSLFGNSSATTQSDNLDTKRPMPHSQTLSGVSSTIPAGTASDQLKKIAPRSSYAETPVIVSSAKDESSQPRDEFEANLSEIGFGLGRLKDMAMKLGDEIGDQNDLLDRITDKSERAGDSVRHQNRQMEQLMKK